MLGTGFTVGPWLKQTIMDFRAINDRLCTLRMRGKFFNISLINVHAPTEDKEEEEKDLFYGRLARIVDACPRHDLIIILGDFCVTTIDPFLGRSRYGVLECGGWASSPITCVVVVQTRYVRALYNVRVWTQLVALCVSTAR